MANPNIVAYLKPSCGWSRGIRAVLAKYGLEYEDKDVINYPENYEEMVHKSGQPLQPCVDIAGQMLADVSGDELEAYLIQNEYKPVGANPDVPTDRACTDEEHEEMARSRPVISNPGFGQ